MTTKGYKQTPEHIEKRKKWGPDHHMWKGASVSAYSARCRARRRFKKTGFCSKCGDHPTEIHHIDGDPRNNEPENFEELCRTCHMTLDGRLDRLIETTVIAQPKAVEAAKTTDRSGTKNPSAKLTEDAVRMIREDLLAGLSYSVLARQYGVTKTAIAFIKRGKSWKTLQ